VAVAGEAAHTAPPTPPPAGCDTWQLLGKPLIPPAGYQPLTVFLAHGDRDTIIPYATNAIASWARYNRCDNDPTVDAASGYTTHAYVNCNASVGLLTIVGGGHTIDPASTSRVWDAIDDRPHATATNGSSSPRLKLAILLGSLGAALLLLLCFARLFCCRNPKHKGGRAHRSTPPELSMTSTATSAISHREISTNESPPVTPI